MKLSAQLQKFWMKHLEYSLYCYVHTLPHIWPSLGFKIIPPYCSYMWGLYLVYSITYKGQTVLTSWKCILGISMSKCSKTRNTKLVLQLYILVECILSQKWISLRLWYFTKMSYSWRKKCSTLQIDLLYIYTPFCDIK